MGKWLHPKGNPGNGVIITCLPWHSRPDLSQASCILEGVESLPIVCSNTCSGLSRNDVNCFDNSLW